MYDQGVDKMAGKIRFVLCFLIISALVSGCGNKNKNYDIALVVKGASTEFWLSVYEGAKAAAIIYEVNLTYSGPKEEKEYIEQISILEDLIVRNPDAIMLAAGEYNLIAEPMERVINAGIPVIMVDSAINSDKWVSFVSTDNTDAGSRLAFELLARVNKTGVIGVVSFVQAAYPSADRETGFLSGMNGSGYRILDTVYCDSNIDAAQQLTEEMIAQNPDLVAIAGLNAQSATGAARALDRLGRSDIVLAGIDCTVEEANFMESGILDVAILQNPYLMGYYAVETTIKHLSGKHVEKNIRTDTYVVDRYNLFSEENQQLIFPFY